MQKGNGFIGSNRSLPISTNWAKISAEDKLNFLINHVDTTVYELISEAPDYDDAIKLLKNTYARASSPIFARYALKTCNQTVGESLDVYLQKLKRLSTGCNFSAVSAKLHKKKAIRDAFIGGILSNEIRQQLLEDHNLSLKKAFDKARSLEIAQENAEAYCVGPSQLAIPSQTIAKIESKLSECLSDEEHSAAIIRKCKYCGNNKHPRKFCPAQDVVCFNCSKRGHFLKVCGLKIETTERPDASTASLFGLEPDFHSLTYSKVNRKVSINGVEANALIDTGSTLSHLSKRFSKL